MAEAKAISCPANIDADLAVRPTSVREVDYYSSPATGTSRMIHHATPWLILPSHAPQLRPLPVEQQNVIETQLRDRQRSMSRPASGVAMLLLDGPLSPSGEYGGTSLMRFQQELADLIEDASTGLVVVVVDSPGGTYSQTGETATMITEARARKSIVTFVGGNGMMASGALWIGTAAGTVYATPSARAVGSIGALMLHTEQTRMLDEMGITTEIIRRPAGKAKPNALEQLDDQTRQLMQADIDDIYSEFVAAIVKQRKLKLSAVAGTDGRTFSTRDSVRLGLIDGVASWPTFIDQLASTTRRSQIHASGLHPRMKLSALRRDVLPPREPTREEVVDALESN